MNPTEIAKGNFDFCSLNKTVWHNSPNKTNVYSLKKDSTAPTVLKGEIISLLNALPERKKNSFPQKQEISFADKKLLGKGVGGRGGGC